MDRYVESGMYGQAGGRVVWIDNPFEAVPQGFVLDRSFSEDEIEETLAQYRIYTAASGKAFAIGRADQSPEPLRELGFRQWAPHVATGWSAYSRDRGEAPGQPGFSDEWDWEIGPSALTPLLRKVANRQAQARREKAA